MRASTIFLLLLAIFVVSCVSRSIRKTATILTTNGNARLHGRHRYLSNYPYVGYVGRSTWPWVNQRIVNGGRWNWNGLNGYNGAAVYNLPYGYAGGYRRLPRKNAYVVPVIVNGPLNRAIPVNRAISRFPVRLGFVDADDDDDDDDSADEADTDDDNDDDDDDDSEEVLLTPVHKTGKSSKRQFCSRPCGLVPPVYSDPCYDTCYPSYPPVNGWFPPSIPIGTAYGYGTPGYFPYNAWPPVGRIRNPIIHAKKTETEGSDDAEDDDDDDDDAANPNATNPPATNPTAANPNEKEPGNAEKQGENEEDKGVEETIEPQTVDPVGASGNLSADNAVNSETTTDPNSGQTVQAPKPQGGGGQHGMPVLG